jgi:hypothetical protein
MMCLCILTAFSYTERHCTRREAKRKRYGAGLELARPQLRHGILIVPF